MAISRAYRIGALIFYISGLLLKGYLQNEASMYLPVKKLFLTKVFNISNNSLYRQTRKSRKSTFA